MADTDIAAQQSLLVRQRLHARFVLEQIRAQGGIALARQATLCDLAEVCGRIVEIKIWLRARGVAVSDQPEDGGLPQAAAWIKDISITNPAPNQGMQGVNHGVVTINNTNLPATSGTLDSRQRDELLALLAQRYRIRMDAALAQQVRLQLGLHTRPDAVDPTWRRMARCGPLEALPLPLGLPLLALFDQSQRQLLVLGAPGAGKTTLLVELAQALVLQAQAQPRARVPVLLNVAAWRKGQSLRSWLNQALRAELGASKRFADQLAAGDDLLLLLDGLDEVDLDHRAACVQAINAYLGEQKLSPPLVVGCRSREYADIALKLQIAAAIELAPLELPVIEQALADVPAAQGVLAALRSDALLRDLASTPLMVNVLLLAHAGQEVPALHAQSAEQRRELLWAAYLRRMLWQRPLEGWGNLQALRWLRWLAQTLRAHSKTNLLLEDLQPTMLPLWPWQRLYVGLMWLIGGSAGTLVGLWAADRLRPLLGFSPFNLMFVPLLVQICVVVIFCLMTGMTFGFKRIFREEKMYWSWDKAKIRVLNIAKDKMLLFVTSLMSLMMGLIGVLIGLKQGGWGEAVFFGLGFVLSCVLIWFFLLLTLFQSNGWCFNDISDRSVPLQGVRTSFLTNMIRLCIVTLSFGVHIGLFGAIWFMIFVGVINALWVERLHGLYNGIFVGCYFGLRYGMPLGLVVGFLLELIPAVNGGFAPAVQHYTVRLFLDRAGLLPFRAVEFLDAASAGLLLERDGAIYRFRHLLLRDFLADLSDPELEQLAHSVEYSGSARNG